jgi:hypothetical protein
MGEPPRFPPSYATRGNRYVFLNFFNLIFLRLLLLPGSRINVASRRMFVSVILRHALKLRYWVAGGAIGGGVAASDVCFYLEN